MEFFSNSLLQKSLFAIQFQANSALAVRLASINYESGNYEAVVNMLEEYIANQPDVPCALIILSNAYAQLGRFQLAVQNLKKAAEIIRCPQTFNYYLQEFEKIKSQEKIVFDSSLNKPTDFKISENFHENKLNSKSEEDTFEGLLVSETLANIYISQGEFKEAIKIYEKLIERKPDNKQKYLDAIEELNSRLKT